MRTSRYDTRRVEQEEEVVASRSGHQRLRFTLGPLPQRHAESHAPPSKQMVKKAARVVLQTRHRDGGCTAPRQATAPYTRRHNPCPWQGEGGRERACRIARMAGVERRGPEGRACGRRRRRATAAASKACGGGLPRIVDARRGGKKAGTAMEEIVRRGKSTPAQGCTVLRGASTLSDNRPATHCHTPSHPVAPWAVMRQGAGSSRTLHTFSTLIVHVCTVAGSSLSLQLPERVAQSAFLAPTTKCRRRAAAVPKCVVKNHFDSNNNG